MQEQEKVSDTPKLRSIFKDNTCNEYADPLEDVDAGGPVIIKPDDYDGCLTAFLAGHVFGVLSRKIDALAGKTVWRISYTEEDKVGNKVEKTGELPQGDKKFRLNEPEKEKLGVKYSVIKDIWDASFRRDDAAVKLGYLIENDARYAEAATNAANVILNGPNGEEAYKQKLREYHGGELTELDENDQRFLRDNISRQVNL
jgi:hypothetical protein